MTIGEEKEPESTVYALSNRNDNSITQGIDPNLDFQINKITNKGLKNPNLLKRNTARTLAHKSYQPALQINLLSKEDENALRHSMANKNDKIMLDCEIMETITDESEASNEEEQIDKFNNVRMDKERSGSIDLDALKQMPTIR